MSVLRMYRGQKIPGLWRFSRQAAGRPSLAADNILPPKHFLAGVNIDYTQATPAKIRDFLRIAIRSPHEGDPFRSSIACLQALSAVFGLDEGNDEKRFEMTRERIIPRLIREPKIFARVMALLPGYAPWAASGKHRLMPLAAAAVNLLEGRNIFDPTAVAGLVKIDAAFEYLTDLHPFYANPFNVPDKYRPDLPNLVLPKPTRRRPLHWLDIATAPKTGGSPTLNMLKAALGGFGLEFHGTDVNFPYYQLFDQKAGYSDFLDPKTGKIKPKTIVNGVSYYSACRPEYDVLAGDFFPGQDFDFISVCMALHHLKQVNDPVKKLPLSSLPLINPAGRQINDQVVLTMPLSTQRAVDAIMRKLDLGGAAFINAFFPGPNPHRNSDMFFIVRRISVNTYMFYDRFPIPFTPNEQVFAPSRNNSWIDGQPEPTGVFKQLNDFMNPGIASINPGRSPEYYENVQRLLDRADLLALRHQSWGKGVWGRAVEAIQAIREKKTLVEILQVYLRNVPDNDQLKIDLINEAGKPEA